MKNILSPDDATRAVDFKVLEISSPAVGDDGMISKVYTCDGENISPPIYIKHIPSSSLSIALIMYDEDIQSGFVHWLVVGIPVTHHVKEGVVHGIAGRNDFNRCSYGGPCPGNETHRYSIKVYALDIILQLSEGYEKETLEKSMSGHILAFGFLSFHYTRNSG